MPRPDRARQRLRELFNNGESLTLEEMQRKLALDSVRHVQRLIAELRAEGIPVQETRQGRRKVFSISPEYREVRSDSIVLSEEEILALIVASEASRSALAATSLEAPLQRAVATLLERFGADIYSFDPEHERDLWHFGSSGSPLVDPHIVRTLAEAIRECRRVRIDYLTASTGRLSHGRIIEPYGLAVRNGSWMTVAFCREKLAVRDFSLSGIRRIELCDPEREEAFFIRPEEFDLRGYFARRFNAVAGERMYDVRILVEPDRAEYFRRKSYHASQRIEEMRPDGRIVVAYRVSGLEEIRAFVQSWGSGATVLEPLELVDRIILDTHVLKERYR